MLRQGANQGLQLSVGSTTELALTRLAVMVLGAFGWCWWQRVTTKHDSLRKEEKGSSFCTSTFIQCQEASLTYLWTMAAFIKVIKSPQNKKHQKTRVRIATNCFCQIMYHTNCLNFTHPFHISSMSRWGLGLLGRWNGFRLGHSRVLWESWSQVWQLGKLWDKRAQARHFEGR